MGILSRLLGKRGRAHAEQLVARGILAGRKGDPRRALGFYEEAADADPTFATAPFNEALARQEIYNITAAALDDREKQRALETIARCFERAVNLDPGLTRGWRSLGQLSERLGDYVRAAEAFQRFVDAAAPDDPQREDIKSRLPELHKLASRARALALARDALDANASDEHRLAALDALAPFLAEEDAPLDAVWAAARLQRLRGARPLAIELLRTLLAEAPRHLDGNRDLATLLLEEGDVRGALACSLAAYRESPLDAGLVCNLGVCHLLLDELGPAAEFIFLAQRLDPDGPIVARAVEQLAARGIVPPKR